MASSRVGLTGRLVLVNKSTSMSAFFSLSRMMKKTGLEKQIKSKYYYEKPTWKRVRKDYEKCVRIYNREMRKKINFVMVQNDPLPSTAVLSLGRHTAIGKGTSESLS